MNQAIFEKIYISYTKEDPLKITEVEYNPPFDMLVGPFKDELAKANWAIRMNSDRTINKIQLAKDRILNALRCGLDICEKKEPYPEAVFLPTFSRVRYFWWSAECCFRTHAVKVSFYFSCFTFIRFPSLAAVIEQYVEVIVIQIYPVNK